MKTSHKFCLDCTREIVRARIVGCHVAEGEDDERCWLELDRIRSDDGTVKLVLEHGRFWAYPLRGRELERARREGLAVYRVHRCSKRKR